MHLAAGLERVCGCSEAMWSLRALTGQGDDKGRHGSFRRVHLEQCGLAVRGAAM